LGYQVTKELSQELFTNKYLLSNPEISFLVSKWKKKEAVKKLTDLLDIISFHEKNDLSLLLKDSEKVCTFDLEKISNLILESTKKVHSESVKKNKAYPIKVQEYRTMFHHFYQWETNYSEKYSGLNKKDRNWYRSKIQIISLNWEFSLLWILLCLNRSEDFYLNKVKFNYYLDFGATVAFQNNKGASFFSVSEAVAKKMNGDLGTSFAKFRCIPFLLPHGNYNLVECQSCNRNTIICESNWDVRSIDTLIDQKKSMEVKCGFCSHAFNFEKADKPLLLQTIYKKPKTGFFNEVEKETRNLIREADHFILFGYSLPRDDLAWRSLISPLLKRNAKVTVLNGKIIGSNSDFLTYDQFKSVSKLNPDKDEVRLFFEANGIPDSNIRFCNGNIPEDLNSDRIKELLNWGVN